MPAGTRPGRPGNLERWRLGVFGIGRVVRGDARLRVGARDGAIEMPPSASAASEEGPAVRRTRRPPLNVRRALRFTTGNRTAPNALKSAGREDDLDCLGKNHVHHLAGLHPAQSLENSRIGDGDRSLAVRPLDRVSGVAVSASRSRNAKPSIVLSGGITTGAFEGLPAKWVQRKVTMTGKFVSLSADNILTVEGPDGQRTIPVADPAILQTLRGMKAGQMVEVVFAEAIQVVLTPR